MRDNKKAPTSAATLAGATDATAGMASYPNFNCTTAAADRQWKISDFIGRSRESATTCRELCALTNLDNRTVRQLIEQERRRGVPIVSDNRHGYWVATTASEVERFCVGMRQRAFEIQKTAAFVRLAALEMDDDE